MGTEKTFGEKLVELKEVKPYFDFNPALVSKQSIKQLIKAHELKYVENIIEVEEEAKLAQDNIEDFLEYDLDVQEAAIAAYEHVTRDPDYFTRPGADQGLYKPVMILQNIANKKNEAKIKTWKVDYHARLIAKLNGFSLLATAEAENKLISIIKSLFSN